MALLATACTPAEGQKIADPGTEVSGTVEFWHFFTDREAEAIAGVVTDFEASHPKVKVDRQGRPGRREDAPGDRRRQGPDVGLSYSTDIVGNFCSSGRLARPEPYIEPDKVDLDQLPPTVAAYTEYKGKRCAMPMLADAYGLYYNKKMFADGRVSPGRRRR